MSESFVWLTVVSIVYFRKQLITSVHRVSIIKRVQGKVWIVSRGKNVSLRKSKCFP